MIVLQDYQHRGARIVDKDVVALDANPLVRYRISPLWPWPLDAPAPKSRQKTMR